MHVAEIANELVEILKEFQNLLGHDDAESIDHSTCPHGGLKGFISDIVPTIIRRLARKCGTPLPEDAVIVNIFASDDKKQRLNVLAAAERFSGRYDTANSKGTENG